MDAETVISRTGQFGAELREGVEPLLRGGEVVAVGPVGAELLCVRERETLRPVVDGLRFRPTRAGQAIAQVGDRVRAISTRNSVISPGMRRDTSGRARRLPWSA